MLYATGGLAWGTNEVGASIAAPGFFAAGTASDTHVGWTVGAGVEWALLDNWSAKVEYLYLDLGNATYLGGPAVRRLRRRPDCTHREGRPELSLRIQQGSGRRALLIDTELSPNSKAPAKAGAFFMRECSGSVIPGCTIDDRGNCLGIGREVGRDPGGFCFAQRSAQRRSLRNTARNQLGGRDRAERRLPASG